MNSPLDAIVLERLINPGEYAHREQVVLKLGALNNVLLAAKITEEKMHSVQLGLPAEASFPAFPGERFEGKWLKLILTSTQSPAPLPPTWKSKIPRLSVKPGLSGFARIHRSAKNVLAVPSIAILNPSGEQASVFVVDDSGHAIMRKIRPGIVVDAMTEVLDGLKEGEKVVTVGQFYLNNNDKVSTTEKSLAK